MPNKLAEVWPDTLPPMGVISVYQIGRLVSAWRGGLRPWVGKRACLHTHMFFSCADAHTVVNTRSLRLPRMWQETHLCGARKVAK